MPWHDTSMGNDRCRPLTADHSWHLRHDHREALLSLRFTFLGVHDFESEVGGFYWNLITNEHGTQETT
jgi:hypothetical protein